MKDCYEWSLKTTPTLAGRIVIDWTIDPQGTPQDIRIESNSMPPSPVPSCLEALILEEWHFPKPTGGDVHVSFPFVLPPGNGSSESHAADPSALSASNRVIFDREAARGLWHFQEADDFWTPAAADVGALEELLPDYIREETARRTARKVAAGLPSDKAAVPLWQRAPSYHRQYVGLVISHRRIIFGNFFCDDPPIDWRRHAVASNGGGDAVFSVMYDVEERRLFAFYVNAAM
jgi:hypothetical protein